MYSIAQRIKRTNICKRKQLKQCCVYFVLLECAAANNSSKSLASKFACKLSEVLSVVSNGKSLKTGHFKMTYVYDV